MKTVQTKGWNGVVTLKGKDERKPIIIPIAPVMKRLGKAKRDMIKAYLAENPDMTIDDVFVFALDRYLRAQGFDKKPKAA